uniref:Orc1-like AAA ATPase domain-containing protein n=1 Tax=Fagus sylvatica TaxID=28930 RepID=A0A2N9HC74_FAGSY
MGKEESPQITRRTTRSSSSATVETTKASDSHPPTINDLVFGEDLISLNDLLSSFPGRRIQILELVRLLGTSNSPMLPLFMYGGASSGKTSIILQMFRHLNRPFVYSSCRSCYSPRILFESVLNQLLLHRKNAANGYSSAKRCERPSDFVNFLREALSNVINNFKGNPRKLGTKKLMPEVGLIFVSNTSPDTYYSNMGYMDPIPVHFPDYTEDDLCQIFLRNQANRKLYSSFLDVVLRPFCRITRRVDELSTAFSPLFEKYGEPLSDLGVVPNEETKRRLFSDLGVVHEETKRRLFSQPHIAPSLNEVFKVSSQSSPEAQSNKETKKKSSRRKLGVCEEIDELDFHMSTSAKYLLISAFLASRNPATLDASLFDSMGGFDSRKRKRKPSQKSLEHKETAEQELLMKGPGTFPLERLLAIFQCLTSVAEGSIDEEEQGNEGLGVQGGDGGLMSDVLLQLSSLCNANFIIKGGSCPLEGSTRYRSTVCEDMALKVARSLKFPLSKYLYRR